VCSTSQSRQSACGFASMKRWFLPVAASWPFGAGFTEVNATIPARAIWPVSPPWWRCCSLITAIIGRWRLAVVGTASVHRLRLGDWAGLPLIQRFQVDPSARTLERSTLSATSRPPETPTASRTLSRFPTTPRQTRLRVVLRADAETTANIRILDPALVTDAFAQLEQFRQYYRFPTVLGCWALHHQR
jgi:uncharacterized protein